MLPKWQSVKFVILQRVKNILFNVLECYMLYSFPKRHILDSSKVNEFADDNFKFDENARKV